MEHGGQQVHSLPVNLPVTWRPLMEDFVSNPDRIPPRSCQA